MNDEKRHETAAELKQIFKKEYPDTDVSKITEDTVLGSGLGIGSLEMMLLTVKIEEHYHIEFKNFPYAETFGDLLDLIARARK